MSENRESRFRIRSGISAGSIRFHEIAFVAIVLGLSIAYLSQRDYRALILNSYFLPIAVSALLLGWLRASGLALLGFCLVFSVTMTDWGSVNHVREIIVVVAWGCTLGATAGITGLLIARREYGLNRLLEAESVSALTDPLTSVANRRAFDFELQRRFAERGRYQRIFTVVMIDVDRFKTINDRFGHEVGDRVLVAIAQTVQHALREVDLVARFGGEEFVVLLPDTDILDGRRVAERIRRDIEHLHISENGIAIPVTVSVGGASPSKRDTEASVMKRADKALYSAKQSGRNQVRFCNGEFEDTFDQEKGAPLPYKLHARAQSSGGYADSITNLPLARIFDEELRRRIIEANRYRQALTVCLLDIDNFDELIEMGESSAEFGLCFIVDRARRNLRETDLMCWYSNHQFAIVFPHTSQQDAITPAERIILDIDCASALNMDGKSLKLELTARLGQVLEDGDTMFNLLARTAGSAPIQVAADALT